MNQYLKNKKYTESDIYTILTAIASYDSYFEVNIAYPHIQTQVNELALSALRSTDPLIMKLIQNHSKSKIDTNTILLKKAIVMLTRSALL